jgi:hypothetical protein
VTVVGADLAAAFPSGKIVDTTEVTQPKVVGDGAAESGASPCSAQVDQVLTSRIGVDVANSSRIEWGWADFDATLQLTVTPSASFIAKGSISASCEKQLWSLQWPVPVQAGPLTIPSYISTTVSVGLQANLTAVELHATVSLPCRIGLRVTKTGATNVSSCDRLRSELTFEPTVTGSVKAFGKSTIGYYIGIDKGWAEANIGLNLYAELAVVANASTTASPHWVVDAYLDTGIELDGAFGPWTIQHSIAATRVFSKRLAEGVMGQSTRQTGTYQITGSSVVGPPASSAATAVTTGRDFGCALVVDGTVRCWGNNNSGRLGNGTIVGSATPVTVTGLTGATAIAAGGDHACALSADGTVMCWGQNYFGQLGNGITTLNWSYSAVPVQVTGLANAVAITASGDHTCALTWEGSVKCWGRSSHGELGGYGWTGTPTSVPGLGAVTSVSTGWTHTCALVNDGGARCWGWNHKGRLGNGTTVDSTIPVVVTGLTGATAISVGGGHTCALIVDGGVRCWGEADHGQLGNDSSLEYSTAPVAVTRLSGAVAITAGSSHSCAGSDGGVAYCWGRNDSGQLGNGTRVGSAAPATVLDLFSVTAIKSLMNHTCAVTGQGRVRCWGLNTYGQLGNGTKTDSTTPVDVWGFGSR